jgi:hypothetical protein
MPVISTLRKLKQKNYKFQASLSYTVGPCLSLPFLKKRGAATIPKVFSKMLYLLSTDTQIRMKQCIARATYDFKRIAS